MTGWELILPVIAGGLRSVAGWAENAFEDGKITAFEWQQLGTTVLRVGILGFATYFGLSGMGVDIDVFSSSAAAVLLDYVLMAVKKKKK